MSEQTPKPDAAGLDPSMDPVALHQLAQARSDLWPQIIAHPNAYPGLLAWFKTQDRPDVQAALAKRAQEEAGGAQPKDEPTLQPKMQPSVKPTVGAGQPASVSRFQRPAGGAMASEGAPDVGAAAATPSTNAAQQVRPISSGRAVPYASRVQRSDAAPSDARPRGEAPEEVEDRTVLATRRKKVLGTLSFGADPVELLKERVIIGRTLKGVDDAPDLQKVLVTDPSKTVSGVHAELTFEDGKWQVKDLDSTNGVYRVHEGGEETEVVGVEPIEGDFYLGDVLFTLEGAK